MERQGDNGMKTQLQTKIKMNISSEDLNGNYSLEIQ